MSEDSSTEFKGVEVHDILGLSQPLTKLAETVTSGIGTLYEPIHIKRIAKAKAFEISLISNIICDNLQLPTDYKNGDVTINSTDINELVQRAQSRFLFQEIQKQQNIEAVVSNAYKNLENETHISETPVDKDWILRFFDSIATIGDEDMQILWGKILSGEVKQPGSFSLRTLETVKNISKAEAEIFQKIVPLVLSNNNAHFLASNTSILKKHGILFSTLLRLSECNLVDITDTICRDYNISAGISNSLFCTNHCSLLIDGKIEGCFSFHVYPLTTAGCELFNILECKPNDNYFLDVTDWIWSKNHQLCHSMKVFGNYQTTNETIDYQKDKPLKEYLNNPT